MARTADVRAWVFMYGSLQPGYWNYDRFLTGELTLAVPATARGHLYYVPAGYPVAKFDGYGSIFGTRLRINLASEAWLHIWAMERGAGYDLVEVALVDGTRALAFEYPGLVDPALCIEDGRWRDR
jgi:gamma-glutamylcyclotransferase (GGCT)/AIG2-like uncharacterized protein YtfP